MDRLASLRGRFDAEARRLKLELLPACAAALRGPREMRLLQDVLLFLAAHPDDAEVSRCVEVAARRLEQAARQACRTRRGRSALRGSGLAGSSIECSFSLDLLGWLTRRFPGQVELVQETLDAAALEAVLPWCVSDGERDGLLCPRISTERWMALAAGATPSLDWLVQRVRGWPAAPELRDAIFDRLELPVRWTLQESDASWLFNRFPPRPAFRQRGAPLLKSFDAAELLRRPARATRLGGARARRQIEVARACLATRARETDPITHANPAEVALFRLDRGIDVALYGMLPERRLPLESFFGYVAARNRIPVAYGGGWVFLDRCEIGINVLPSFRGGESGYLFGQVLRVYHQHLGARRFVVDPYQFGDRNAEAIRSGAYWFYDRLGFRSADPRLAALAEREREARTREAGHRTPPALLRRLAGARLELDVGDAPIRAPDLDEIGLGLTSDLARRGGGDALRAQRWAMRRLPGAAAALRRGPAQVRERLRRLLPLAAVLDAVGDLPRASRSRLLRALAAKGGPRERDYVRRMRADGAVVAALERLAERGRAIAAGDGAT